MSSIQEVAKKAGVGVGTVSRVINDSGYVSEKTRRKVEEVIEELNYKPNELARNLFRNRTNIVAVITPAIGNPYYATLCSEVESRLRKYGYKTMLCNTTGESTNEEAYLEMLERNMVDGIITGTHTLDYSSYKKIKGPIVGFDTPKLNDDILVVTVNHEEGGKLAAKSLIESGCKEVLQFTDATTKNYPFIKRHTAFANEIKKTGIICREYKPLMDRFDYEYIEENIDAFNPETGELLLGDIILSTEHILEQAKEYGHSKTRELAFLVVHSMLHLMGYDHMEDDERIVMEEKQRKILELEGISR